MGPTPALWEYFMNRSFGTVFGVDPYVGHRSHDYAVLESESRV